MKRKISAVIIVALLCMSSVVILNKDFGAEASGGCGEGEDEGIGLDYDFMWNVTINLSNVVHKYPDDTIPKGRAFGTWGDNYTADNILVPRMIDIDLEDVDKLQIGPIDKYINRHYSSKIEVLDFKFEINNTNFTRDKGLPCNVPKNETFPVPSGFAHVPLGDMTHNYTFEGIDNIRVLPQNMTKSSWPLGPFSSRTYYNVSSSAISTGDFDTIIGKVTYVESNESLPAEQEFVVFMIEEAEGCEDKLDNITNATGVILIHNETTLYCTENLMNRSFNAVRVTLSATNLTNVTEELKNGTLMFADNVIDDEILTFTECLIPDWWPDYNFFIIYNNILGIKVKWAEKAGYVWGINNFCNPQYKCKGFILYDLIPDTHLMLWHNRDWFRIGLHPKGSDKNKHAFPYYGLPMFLINMSVGEWLVNNSDDSNTTIVGYINQDFKKEKHKPIDDPEQWTVGVEAYNVIGNITIDKSPNDNIVIISNRYDGWWGECPGDSGLGGGMVLAIAKYFKDNNIKPKYNLTFLMTTGEELGFRGAQHYSDSHEDDNIIFWIGLDQLGQDVEGSKLVIDLKYDSTNKTVMAILNETKYKERSNDRYDNKTWVTIDGGGGTEASVWKQRTGTDCKTVCFHKNSVWDYHHRTGLDYTRGDVLEGTIPGEGIDRDDANLTLELVWNITKYFTVDPDCWFNNVTYETFDSPNDGDTLNDSIRATFEINTIMPHDKVRVWADIIQYVDDTGDTINYTRYNDYTITYPGVEKTWIFPIPDLINHGECSVQLKLMNSTGRIDYIATLGGTTNYNDTTARSDYYHLYHPFGYPIKGSEFVWASDLIVGSTFTVNENAYADNITAYVYQDTGVPVDSSTCMIYRKNDSSLIGTTEELTFGMAMGGNWITYDFEEDKPPLVKDTEYVLVVWGEDTHVYYDDFAFSRGRFNETTYGGSAPDPISFTNENRLYSICCSYTPEEIPPEITNVSNNPDTVGFGFNVTISADVTDNLGVDMVKVNIIYPDDSSQEYTMDHTTGDTYEYVFSDTWFVGQYSYIIWAVDYAGNSNSSTGYSFNVSAKATISVCTIKDNYGDNEYVNLTDPPNGGEEQIDTGGPELVKQGEYWNKYYNATSGQYRLDVYGEPINYLNETGWHSIDTMIYDETITVAGRQYIYGMTHANYSVYYREKSSKNWKRPIAFIKDNYTITFSPWDNLRYDEGTQVSGQKLSVAIIENDTIVYPQQYGEGIDLQYICDNTRVQERLFIDNRSRFPQPDNEEANLVVKETIRAYELVDGEENRSTGILYGPDKLNFKEFNDWTDNEITTNEEIWFQDEDNNTVFYIPKLYAWDSNDTHGRLLLNKSLHMTRFGNLRIEIYTPFCWLNDTNTTYPVFLDADIHCTAYSTSDTYLSEYNPNTPHGTGNTLYVDPKITARNRFLIQMDLPSELDDAYISCADLNIYYYAFENWNPVNRNHECWRIGESWGETTATWNNQPAVDGLTDTCPVGNPGHFNVWDVASNVQDFIEGDLVNYGWLICDENEGTVRMFVAKYYSKEKSGTSCDPHLDIYYVAPPVLQTNPSSGVEETNITMNGLVVDDGGQPCQYRFSYNKPVGMGSIYSYTVWGGSKYMGQSFSDGLTGMPAGRYGFYRAQLRHSFYTAVVRTGSLTYFLTKPDTLTGFTATAYGYEQINLMWSNGNGGDGAYIEWHSSADETWEPGDHTKIGNVTGESFSHENLSQGTAYYYKAWAYAEDGGWRSVGNASMPFGDNPGTDSATTEKHPPDPPCSFTATKVNRTKIDISWTKGARADKTHIQYKEGATPPSNPRDGTFLYNNTGTSTSATGLIPGMHYTFAAWSWNETSSCFSTSATDSATTDSNNLPMITDEHPVNGSTGVGILPTLNVTVDDADNDMLEVVWASNSSGSWIVFAINDSIDTSGGPVNIIQTNSNFSSGDTTYWWTVSLSDAWDITYKTYHFTTSVNIPPTQSGEAPSSGSTGISLTPDLYVLCNDANNDNLNATWWSNSSGSWMQFAFNWTSFASNTNITQSFTNASAYSTKYYWSVNLTDGTEWTNETYHFTTVSSNKPPEIGTPTIDNEIVGYGYNVTINVSVWDNDTGLTEVKCDVTYPDSTSYNSTMANTGGAFYEKEINLTDTWQLGWHNYTIWATDGIDSNTSSQYSFNVSAQCNVTLQTEKDNYGWDEYVNLTDPPEGEHGDKQQIGYELLDNNRVLHLWNKHNDYYFNTSSGIQLTNHYNEYWSHNVLMLGYYNDDEWNLLYRNDQLTGFNKNIDTDNETYVNAILWKDLSYDSYDFRLAIRYCLGVNDSDLTVIPYIKNMGIAIPYQLGFGWELKDIKINSTTVDDQIRINNTRYFLNQTLDMKYTNTSGEFYLEQINDPYPAQFLYLKWNPGLNYLVWVKTRDGQHNAPVTLFIRVGTLDSGQEKSTILHWLDAEGDFIESWYTEGPAPCGIANDGNYIWIVDNYYHMVFKYTMDGYWIDHWDIYECDDPYGIATDGNYIWIIDNYYAEVFMYEMDGYWTGISWPTVGSDPRGITTDGNYIWIVDNFYSEVYVYTMDGYCIDCLDIYECNDPYGITTDGNHIWVVDNYYPVVFKYTMDGYWIDYWDTAEYGNEHPLGITTNGVYFWITDAYAEVYKYEGSGTAGNLYERYNTGDDEAFPFVSTDWAGQTFTIGNTGVNEDHSIISVKLKLFRYGLPGTITVSIRKTDELGRPAGEDLTSGTTNGNTLTEDENGEWREITLTPYTLSESTKYAIVVRALEGDPENILLWRLDHSEPTYAGGSLTYSWDSGSSWDLFEEIDFMFETYGEGPIIPLDESVDNYDLSWTTGGNADWFGQNQVYYYDKDAVESGDINDNQNTWIKTTVNGPGILKFYWKVNSEQNWDYLRFYIDDFEQTKISGDVNWQQKPYNIISGSHELMWKYTKDGSVSVGSDCGWLDFVEWTAINNPPTVTSIYPMNGSMDIPLESSVTCRIWANDTDGDNLDVTWATNESGSWTTKHTNTSIPANSVVQYTFNEFDSSNTIYWWKVYANDGTNNVSRWFYFTTELGYIQSKIENTGSTNSKGYLLMQIQYKDSGSWYTVEDTIDETSIRTINSGEYLKLDGIFNGTVYTSTDLANGTGQYRVYGALRDKFGDVLVNDDGTSMDASYEFNYISNATLSISDENPTNGTIDISLKPTLSITINNDGGGLMDLTWWSNSSGPWVVFGSNYSVGNGTYYQIFSNVTVNGQWWYWKVNVSDEITAVESDIYCFFTGHQSKIVNTGSTDIRGYLLMQVHYFDETLDKWVIVDDTINETISRTINAGEQLALDEIFNTLVNTSNLSYGNGTYRVYAAFRDPYGNVLECDNNYAMEANFEFKIARHMHGWFKLFADDGFGKASNLFTRGITIYKDEMYIGTENHNKSKLNLKDLLCNGFLAGTSIIMADGSYKNIEDIKVGDIVKACDIGNGSCVNANVTMIFNYTSEWLPDNYLTFNNQICVSPNHLLYVNDTLMKAEYAQIGDYFTDVNSSNVTITSTACMFEKPSGLYNFLIAVNGSEEPLLPSNLTYFAENVRVYPWGSSNISDYCYDGGFPIITFFKLFLGNLTTSFLTWLVCAISDGCELWKYNYTNNEWTELIGNTTGDSDLYSGFGDHRNAGIGDMIEFNGKLYVGTGHNKGCEIWRYDGSSWEQVVGENDSASIGRGFNDPFNSIAATMKVFENSSGVTHLYVGTINFNWESNGFCQIWRTADGENWYKVVDRGFRDNGAESDVKNAYLWSMEVFQDKLYAGTFNIPYPDIMPWHHRGCQLWRTDTGNACEWEKVILPGENYGNGFGEDKNYGIRKLVKWGNNLYVGVAASALQVLTKKALEIWKYDGSDWTCIVGDESSPPEKKWDDGFGDYYNKYPWSMVVANDTLWIGTLNHHLKVNLTKPFVHMLSEGCEVWCYNGTDLIASVDDVNGEKDNGFGQWFNRGARSMIEYPVGSGNIVVGTMTINNPLDKDVEEEGCEIWMWYP